MLHRDVARLLRLLGMPHEQKASKSRFDVMGPFTANTRSPGGSMIARHRLLSARGWAVISVPYFLWEELTDDVRGAWLLQEIERARQSRAAAAALPADDFGLQLQAIHEGTELSSLYRSVFFMVHTPSQMPVRYVGVYTDGGADMQLRQYSVDNMFSPNNWESYCSAGVANINAIGMLLAESCFMVDQEQECYRGYLLRRLLPATQAFYSNLGFDAAGVPAGELLAAHSVMERLAKRTTAELEGRLAEFFDRLLQGDPLGLMLLHGVCDEELQRERQLLAHTVDRMPQRHTRKMIVDSPPDQPLVQLVLPQALAANASDRTHVGVFRELLISRKGAYSCPVSSGVIFAVNAEAREHSTEPLDAYSRDLLAAMADLVGNPVSKVCCDLKSKSDVLAACRSGALPEPAACFACDAGVWIEFEPAWPPPAVVSAAAPLQVGAPRPVVWFHFFTHTEAHNLRLYRANGGHSDAALPQAIWDEEGPWAREICLGTNPEEDEDGAALGEVPPPVVPPPPPPPGDPPAEQAAQEEAMEAADAAAAGTPASGAALARMLVFAVMASALEQVQAGPGGVVTPDMLATEVAEAAGAGDAGPAHAGMAVGSDDGSAESEEMPDGDISDEEAQLADMEHDMEGLDDHMGTYLTGGRNTLEIKLKHFRAGSAVLVKLVDQENLMTEFEDEHEAPNIDRSSGAGGAARRSKLSCALLAALPYAAAAGAGLLLLTGKGSINQDLLPGWAARAYDAAAAIQIALLPALAALALLAAALAAWRRERARCFLLDFACYKPPDHCKVDLDCFLEGSRNFGKFSEEALEFQERISQRNGLSYGETYLPDALHMKPPIINMEMAREEARMVLFGSIQEVLERTGLTPKDIDILVVNCSLFNPTPSLSAMIVNHFKMRSDLISYNLAGMGCSAGVIAIGLAERLLRSEPGKYALVVSTENITQNWYLGSDRSMLIPNTLFRMGGAAMVLTNRLDEAARAKYELQHVVRVHLGADDKAYRCVYQREDDAGVVGVELNRDLVKVASKALERNLTRMGPLVLPLGEKLRFALNLAARKLLGMKLKPYVPDFRRAFNHFCLHAGGRGVIEGLGKQLNLNRKQVEPSFNSLYWYGNTSSASVWYALSYIEACQGVRAGETVWQVGFGSGFKCNSAVWKARRTIRDNRHAAWAHMVNGNLDCVWKYLEANSTPDMYGKASEECNGTAATNGKH
ncbi:hypothetical protein WJX81_004571 [Elliptochloris bilobata]|uniref:very-long-chain 3-oxoacyl-CoA synthase n=1 Tax=Elliptochloris bilobata TaxID=381761 RepID=A0AAW1S8G4_9CHLO